VLPELTPPGSIPPLIFADEALHLLAMQAVPQPHQNWKQLLLDGGLEQAHVDQFAQILAQIHTRSHERAADLAPRFADRSFFESLRLEPYYLYAAAQAPAAAGFLSALVDETRRQSLALVHGDYSPKNILVYAGQLILLDHEVIHWGDPAFDVGFALTHLLGKANHLEGQRAAFASAALRLWDVYRQIVNDRFGRDYEARAARHLAACLLARVVGRSPLEYLGADARARQLGASLALIASPPDSIPALITAFVKELDR
jgi:aminoglycoside phosphotransferase (APT) family kinase protein